jgi:hypothetical protein
MDDPTTAAAWRRCIRVRTAWLLGELLCWTAAVLHSAVSQRESAIGPAVMTTLIALVLVPVSLHALVSAQRMGRVLRTYPWQTHPCSFDRRGRETRVVLKPEPGQEVFLRTIPFRVHLNRDQGATPTAMWFAGDLRVGGVVSPAGGHRPVRTVRVNLSQHLRKARRRADPGADALAQKAGLMPGGASTTSRA